VKVRFYKGALTILARSSLNVLYFEDLVSFDSQSIDQKDADGFARYHGFQARMYRKVMEK
jgi:argininosuccinate synthase